ncbi:T9SS type A sorting domain-containing protein [Flavobacterium lindanitolerans]|nr:T9SS type A sorting domain-containing protein [Flavobacterium lindanitolerans]
MTERVTTRIESLSDKDYEFSNRFMIFPNPSSDFITITNKDEILIKSVTVYNIMGQPVRTFSSTFDTKVLDISNLASGNYVIRIYSDEGTATAKFVKY